jgi:hypothetical protein
VLGHRLQQRGLHLRRGAVDLVGQHQVREHRAELGVEALRGRPPDPGPDDVARHQVRGELQPGEPAADHLGQGADGERLGHSRHALEQAVPAGEQGDQHPLDQVVLADHDPLHLEQRVLEDGGRPVGHACSWAVSPEFCCP